MKKINVWSFRFHVLSRCNDESLDRLVNEVNIFNRHDIKSHRTRLQKWQYSSIWVSCKLMNRDSRDTTRLELCRLRFIAGKEMNSTVNLTRDSYNSSVKHTEGPGTRWVGTVENVSSSNVSVSGSLVAGSRGAAERVTTVVIFQWNSHNSHFIH